MTCKFHFSRSLSRKSSALWLVNPSVHSLPFSPWFISRRRFSYRWSRGSHRTKPTRWPQLKWKEQTISKKANLVVQQGQHWTNKRSAKRLTWSLNRFSTEWIGTRPICISYEHLVTATRMHSSKIRTVRCSGRRGRGCLSRGRVSARGGAGCLPCGGLLGGVSAQGVYSPHEQNDWQL